MNKKFISDFKINEQVDSFFMLNKKELKLTKYDKPYLQITLSDRTGKIEDQRVHCRRRAMSGNRFGHPRGVAATRWKALGHAALRTPTDS